MRNIIHDPIQKRIDVLDSRYYTNNGITFYPSVTTVLEALPKGIEYYTWLKDLGHGADEVLKRAANTGSKVHAAIEKYLLGEELLWIDENGNELYTYDEWVMLFKFVEFWTLHTPELLGAEINIISDKHKIGGTIDIVCRINGKLWLIDVKTSNSIHDSHALQLAAYSTLFNDFNPNDKIERFGIMWLKALTRGADKKGEKIQGAGWQLKEFDEPLEDLWSSFCDVRRVWDRQNPNYKPKNLTLPDRLKLSEVKSVRTPEPIAELV